MITTLTHVFFYSGREIYSNWHTTPAQFVDPITGLTFDNTEQAFMWYKATFFSDVLIAAEAAATTDPRAVKELGRKVRGYNDKAWECVRLGYMTYVNYLKYSQNKDMGDVLKATGSRILVEASPYDGIWGIKRTVEEAAAGATWQGRNLLGVALETVRALL